MSQTRLVDLARLTNESSIARQVDFDSAIRNFAQKSQKSTNEIVELFFKLFFFLIFLAKILL